MTRLGVAIGEDGDEVDRESDPISTPSERSQAKRSGRFPSRVDQSLSDDDDATELGIRSGEYEIGSPSDLSDEMLP